MSPPVPYEVVSSGRVNAALKALLRRAVAAGKGTEVREALSEIYRLLRIYPQFGEPLRDLTMAGETIYVMSIPPVYVEYIVDEPHRLVFIVAPFKVMPFVGFE